MEVSPQVQARLDQIAKLPQSARASIIFGIAALVVAGYYFGVYSGMSERLDGLRANELELQRKLSGCAPWPPTWAPSRRRSRTSS